MTDRPEAGPAPAKGDVDRANAVELVVRSDRLILYVIGCCMAAEVLFVLLDYHVNYGRLTEIGAIRRLFNIAREDSLASWFGTTQSVLIALTLWLTYVAVRRHSESRWVRTGWLVLASFFSYMAVDDGALLHERAGTVFSEVFDNDPDPGESVSWIGRLLDIFPSYAWQVVVLPLFVALGAFLLFFLWRELDRRSTRLLVIAALGCFVVAIGLDFVEGLDRDHRFNLITRIVENFDFGDYTEYRFRRSAYDTLAHFSKSIEEFLEMLGNTLLWSVFLRNLTKVASNLHVRFVEK